MSPAGFGADAQRTAPALNHTRGRKHRNAERKQANAEAPPRAKRTQAAAPAAANAERRSKHLLAKLRAEPKHVDDINKQLFKVCVMVMDVRRK